MARGKQERLPGTNNGIPELDNIGEELKAIETERMELTKRETDLRAKGLVEMHKNNLTHYLYGGIELFIETGEEKLKVRSSKPKKEKKAA